jgi:hypothetical protein
MMRHLLVVTLLGVLSLQPTLSCMEQDKNKWVFNRNPVPLFMEKDKNAETNQKNSERYKQDLIQEAKPLYTKLDSPGFSALTKKIYETYKTAWHIAFLDDTTLVPAQPQQEVRRVIALYRDRAAYEEFYNHKLQCDGKNCTYSTYVITREFCKAYPLLTKKQYEHDFEEDHTKSFKIKEKLAVIKNKYQMLNNY